MIFIGFFVFIGVIVLSLSIHNSSNLSTIEEYIKKQNCEQYIYSKGSYKAICEDKILEVSNSFSVKLDENSKEYKYEDIKSIKVNKLDIIVNEKNKLRFKEEDVLNKFYKDLEKKLNK